MSAVDYLKDTEPAVQQLFNGLGNFDSIKPPSIMQFVDDTGHVRMSKEEADFMVRASLDSMDLEFSRAILAGSILQVEYVGLKEYSKNYSVTPLCEKL